eukprot:TRINITY_DN17766_c0_g1_i12.p1 TRINITY_DN17766_c0_g1~~TRINITY_DN17766_c0_g1_i12.p1  ORF type:complete len:168 (+),score=28.40 TRINITY_DN17766_c0_g1_i12:146-649(+)
MLRSLVGSEMCIRDRVSTQSTGDSLRMSMLKTVFLVLSLMASIALAENCDPSKLHYQVFNDEDCTILNQSMTKAMATVPKQFWGLYDGKCHEVPPSAYHIPNASRLSIRIQCDPSGFHEQIFVGPNCSQRVIMFNAGWGSCVDYGPVSKLRVLWVVPKSGQFPSLRI